MDRSWWIGPLLVVFLALLLTLPGVPSVARGASPAAAPGAHPALAATAPRHHDPDPANISVNGVSPSAVSVSWNDTDDRPMGGYNLSYSTSGDSGPWTLAANVASGPNNSSQQYSWQGLSPGTTYWLTVTEVDSPSLQTDPGPVVRETQPPVAHLTSSNPNATTIALAWDNRAQYGGGISFGGYAVESSTNGGGWAIVTVITNASNRSATLSGLDPTASYSFRVATTDVCCGGSPVTTTSNTVNYSAVPPMGASASVRPASADVGQALNFTCTGRGGLPPYSYTWNFGDGTTATGQTASHAYGTPGPYSATCTVQDSRGYSATAPPRA
jgi:PKD repeat protein